MKRTVTLLIVLCLLLCACGPKYEVPYASTEATTEATTVATTEATTAPTEPPIVYRHPLTGEVLDAPYTGRPTAIVINNIKACLPQYGISNADMIYEVETEGGITRLLAIFTTLENTATIGPVRSARTYFNNLSASYGIPIIHCGGSGNALAGKYDLNNKLSTWDHIDQTYNGSYFFRDKARRSQGYALEHTLFTTGEDMIAALADKGYDKVSGEEVNYGLQFAEELTISGEAASSITVTFRAGAKTTTMTYNATSGLYEAAQYKKAHIDATTGNTLSYTNVLVLKSTQTQKHDGTYNRSYYELIGEGDGYFAYQGQIVPIRWSRSSVDSQFAYTLADGTPLTLGVGKTYVGVIGTNGSAGVAYQ